jgi:hypothetical protein
MKALLAFSTSLLLLGVVGGPQAARADTADANCEVRKDGDKQKGRSGPCTVLQRQGFIEIDLKNGDTISLSPGNNAGHLKDQHGNKVSRTSTGNGMSLHWENGRHVTVRWEGNRYGSSTYDSNSYKNNRNYTGSGGNHNAEYRRGYDDGLRGNWDQNSHNQDYKDGYRAAETGGGGNGGQHSGHGDHSINQLGNGQFEVVWSKPFCSVLIGRDGGIKQTTEDCTNQQVNRAREVGRRGY